MKEREVNLICTFIFFAPGRLCVRFFICPLTLCEIMC
jgi:hypothetical protein